MSVLLISQEIDIKNKIDRKINNAISLNYKSKTINIEYLNDKTLFEQDKIIDSFSMRFIGFMLGEIYGFNKEKDELIKKGYKFKTNLDIEFILNLYEEYGINSIKNLNGKFIICIYDKLSDETIIINDRYGYYTYYYYRDNNTFSFCNDPNVLVKLIPSYSINKVSVNEYLNFGYILNNKTMIKEIEKMHPATIFRIKNETINSEIYWRWDYIKKNKSINYNKAVELVGVYWIRAVKKIIEKHENFILPISGGLDSRAIIAAIDYLGFNKRILKAFTMGNINCSDYKIASEVCKIANINHELVTLDNKNFIDEDDEFIKNSLGSVYCIAGFPQKYIMENINYPFLNGLAGDLVLGGGYLDSASLENKEDYIKFCNYKLHSLGVDDKKNLKDYSYIEIEPPISNKNYSTDYYFLNNSRVRNFTIYGSAGHGPMMNDLIPFFDNDLIDFIYSLPDEWRIGSRLYKDMLIKFFPKFFVDIPWQNSGNCIKELSIRDYKKIKFIIINRYKHNIKINKINKTVILFGASKLGIKAEKILKHKYKNILFCDNDKSKWNKTINNRQIISVDSLKEMNLQDIKIIITSMYFKEISKTLISVGVDRYYIFNDYKNRSFQNFSGWIRCKEQSESIFNILKTNSEVINTFIDNEKILDTFNDHLKYKSDNWKDIMLVYTFIKFCRMYF